MYLIDPIFWLQIYRIDPLFSHVYIDIASFLRPRQSLHVLFGSECPPPPGPGISKGRYCCWSSLPDVDSGISNTGTSQMSSGGCFLFQVESVLTEFQLDQLVEVAQKDCCWGAPHSPRSFRIKPPKWPWGVSADDPPTGQKFSLMDTLPFFDSPLMVIALGEQ